MDLFNQIRRKLLERRFVVKLASGVRLSRVPFDDKSILDLFQIELVDLDAVSILTIEYMVSTSSSRTALPQVSSSRRRFSLKTDKIRSHDISVTSWRAWRSVI